MKNQTSVQIQRNDYGLHIVFPLLLLLLLFSANQAQAAKSYRMEQVSIVADLAADGSMKVAEERTYRFKGKFKYAFRSFALDSRIKYENFLVSENDQPYALSDSKEPGTYTVTTTDEDIEVRWYFRARRETKAFKIEYTVQDAVKRHLDSAVLYYQFLGGGFRKSTQLVDILVNPPVPVDEWDVRQWAHGPLWASSETSAQGTVTATCENLPRKKFFELRILYPAEMFSDAPLISSYIVGEVTAEESAWADEANWRREEANNKAIALKKRQGIGLWALPAFVLLAAGWFYRIFKQYGTRPTTPPVPSQSPEIPSDLPPAIVSYLLNDRSVGASAIMSTLMDLARRGFLEFKEEHELGKNFMGKEKWETNHSWTLKNLHYKEHSHELIGFEDMLIKFVFEDLAEAQPSGSATISVSLKQFKNENTKVEKFFGTWTETIKKEAEKYNFFDQKSFKGRDRGVILGLVTIVVAVPMIPLVHALALIPAVAGVTILLASLGIVHHTRDGLIASKKWKSLKSYLKKQGFKSAEPQSVLDFIEPYFIYGVVMGLSKNQLEGLGSMIPAEKGLFYMPWYHHAQSAGGFDSGSFGTSFSTAVASGDSAVSSSTGSGGGASGGGGGGGAGGGGGGAG